MFPAPRYMETVRHYHRLGEVLPYDVPVRAVHVDAHHTHAVTPFQRTKKRMKGGNALAEGDIEDLVLAKVAERGGKARTPRETMLVDTEKTWTEPVLELRVLKQDHLVIEAFGRSYGNAL